MTNFYNSSHMEGFSINHLHSFWEPIILIRKLECMVLKFIDYDI